MRCTASAVFSFALLPLALALAAQSAPPALRSGTLGGIHAGTPAIVSVAVGGYHDLSRSAGTDRAQTVFALLEPGVNAGRISMGFGDAYGNLGTGWTLRGTLLRRWRGAIGNYVGVEASMMALGFGPRLGIFRQVGTGVSSSVRVTADFAFGL